MSDTNGYISPFIGDGYDIEQTIPAEAGRWSAVSIRYRPLSADEESLIFAKKNLQPTTPIVRLYAETFAGDGKTVPPKLLGWDLKDRAGQPVKITADNLGKLSPQFWEEIKCRIDGTIVLPSGETEREADTKNSSGA